MNRAAGFLLLTVLGLVGLTGCLNLKKASDPTRFYTLSPHSGAGAAMAGTNHLAVGIGRVAIPAYLLDRRIALRSRENEIKYLEYHRWAERLDHGLQRVLAVNLSSSGADRVVLSAWRREEVAVEVHLVILQFECDERGEILVEAQWRLAAPGGEQTLRSGHFRMTRPAPTPPAQAEGAVSGWSAVLSDLSKEIAVALEGVSNRSH